MNTSRHISIDDEYIEKIRPYLEKHNGNFAAAIREMIYKVGKHSQRTNSSSIETSLFRWMLAELDGVLLPDDIVDDLIDPKLMNSMGKLEDHVKKRFIELEWDIEISIECDVDTFPSKVSIEMMGSPQQIKFAACLLSQFLVKNSLGSIPLEIRSVVSFSDCIKVELYKSGAKEAQKSLMTFFGKAHETIKTIRGRPAFWKTVINRHLASNYSMVTVHRNYFEDLLADKIPAGEITLETLAKKPVQEIPLKDMLFLIKQVYEASRVVDRVEIDKDSIIIFHSYRTTEAVEKLKKSILSLLEASGHIYDGKSTANMIMLTHRPDVGRKVNEIVDNLKTSNSRVDQELVVFMTFLQGLKDIPDIPISLTALGRRIGKSLMQEYEKENDIRHWNLENFQKALATIDSRLHRESEWKLEGKDLLYIVRKCNIADEGDTFDTYVCHTARETFKGALNYAFGNKAVLNIMHLVTHGDNFCEVIIRIP
ncbi:MAG TPA: hypothetical protein VIO11_03825 [Candidatus Methanoperedens sp.]